MVYEGCIQPLIQDLAPTHWKYSISLSPPNICFSLFHQDLTFISSPEVPEDLFLGVSQSATFQFPAFWRRQCLYFVSKTQSPKKSGTKNDKTLCFLRFVDFLYPFFWHRPKIQKRARWIKRNHPTWSVLSGHLKVPSSSRAKWWMASANFTTGTGSTRVHGWVVAMRFVRWSNELFWSKIWDEETHNILDRQTIRIMEDNDRPDFRIKRAIPIKKMRLGVEANMWHSRHQRLGIWRISTKTIGSWNSY